MSKRVYVVMRLDWDEVDHRSDVTVIGIYEDIEEARLIRSAEENIESNRDSVIMYLQEFDIPYIYFMK